MNQQNQPPSNPDEEQRPPVANHLPGNASAYNVSSPGMQLSARRGNNGMAVAGMILGILSLTLGCVAGCPVAFSIPGLILSYIGRNQIRETGEDGHGMAVAGIIMNWISIGIMILGFVLLIVFLVMQEMGVIPK